jgi:hypothetical protein
MARTIEQYARQLLKCGVHERGDYCCSSTCDGEKIPARYWGFCGECYLSSLFIMEREYATSTDAMCDYFGCETWDAMPLAERETHVELLLSLQAQIVRRKEER